MLGWLYGREIGWLYRIQRLPFFESYEELWLRATKLGDPSWTFWVYFPLLFPLHPSLAIRFLLAGALGEYGNGVLKWLLHGERPYWYVAEAGLNSTMPLRQFRYTCETGPGSPSGHVMVSASVFFVLVLTIKAPALKKVGYSCLGVFLVLVSLSRLFIAAHFPHQVLLGCFTGLYLGKKCKETKPETWTRSQPFLLSLLLCLIGFVTYYGLMFTGFDPNWSIQKAIRWCSQPEWVHLSTHPMSSLFRDIGALLGLSIVYPLVHILLNNPHLNPSTFRSIFQAITNLALVQIIHRIPLPTDPILFYVSTMGLHIFLSIAVIHVFPSVFGSYRLLQNLNVESRKKTA